MEQRERISKLDAILFALSLEVGLQQMKIAEGSTDMRIKYRQPANKLESLQIEKLVRDREMVKDVMRRTLIEVADDGLWQNLQQVVELLRERASVATSLRLTNEQLRRTRDTFNNERDMKRNQWATELSNAEQQIAVLRDKMNDDLINSNTRLHYADKWLFARAESLELRCDAPRAPVPRLDNEQRVHEQLLRAYELQIKEREESLEYWRDRYDIDIFTISKRVAEKCEQLRAASNRRVELQKLYDLHTGEMRAWLTFKRERAARLEREERQRASATRIQAWWRGVMVRKALGAFKYLRHSKKSATKAKKK